MAYQVRKSIRLNGALVLEDVQINASDVVGLSTMEDPNVQDGLQCHSSVFVGAIVRKSTSTIFLAQADTVSNSHWFGICVAKNGTNCCTVRFPSVTSAVFSSLVINDNYFLSDSSAGMATTVVPTANSSVIAPIGNAFTSQRLVLTLGDKIIRRT